MQHGMTLGGLYAALKKPGLDDCELRANSYDVKSLRVKTGGASLFGRDGARAVHRYQAVGLVAHCHDASVRAHLAKESQASDPEIWAKELSGQLREEFDAKFNARNPVKLGDLSKLEAELLKQVTDRLRARRVSIAAPTASSAGRDSKTALPSSDSKRAGSPPPQAAPASSSSSASASSSSTSWSTRGGEFSRESLFLMQDSEANIISRRATPASASSSSSSSSSARASSPVIPLVPVDRALEALGALKKAYGPHKFDGDENRQIKFHQRLDALVEFVATKFPELLDPSNMYRELNAAAKKMYGSPGLTPFLALNGVVRLERLLGVESSALTSGDFETRTKPASSSSSPASSAPSRSEPDAELARVRRTATYVPSLIGDNEAVALAAQMMKEDRNLHPAVALYRVRSGARSDIQRAYPKEVDEYLNADPRAIASAQRTGPANKD